MKLGILLRYGLLATVLLTQSCEGRSEDPGKRQKKVMLTSFWSGV